MPNIQVTIQHKVGLHARPAALFVKCAASFPCTITARNVTTDSKSSNAKSILKVLSLGVKQGHTVEVQAEGPQAEQALDALQELVLSNFGEL